MNIQEMHYDFKFKLNKLDTKEFQAFGTPEIDWILNEAQEVFIKNEGFPKQYIGKGFEQSKRSREYFKPLIKTEESLPIVDNVVTLPEDYLFFIKGTVGCIIRGGTGTRDTGKLDYPVKCRFLLQDHDDEFENSTFYKTSILWREVIGVLNQKGLLLDLDNKELKSIFDNGQDGEIVFDTMKLTYIKTPQRMSFGSINGGYTLPGNVVVDKDVDCELSNVAHREVVDLAVLIASTKLNNKSKFELEANKLKLNV